MNYIQYDGDFYEALDQLDALPPVYGKLSNNTELNVLFEQKIKTNLTSNYIPPARIGIYIIYFAYKNSERFAYVGQSRQLAERLKEHRDHIIEGNIIESGIEKEFYINANKLIDSYLAESTLTRDEFINTYFFVKILQTFNSLDEADAQDNLDNKVRPTAKVKAKLDKLTLADIEDLKVFKYDPNKNDRFGIKLVLDDLDQVKTALDQAEIANITKYGTYIGNSQHIAGWCNKTRGGQEFEKKTNSQKANSNTNSLVVHAIIQLILLYIYNKSPECGKLSRQDIFKQITGIATDKAGWASGLSTISAINRTEDRWADLKICLFGTTTDILKNIPHKDNTKKAVTILDYDTRKVIATFDSQKKAGEYLGIDSNSVRKKQIKAIRDGVSEWPYVQKDGKKVILQFNN